MHYVFLVIITVTTAFGLDSLSLDRKEKFSYYYLHNLTHVKLESIFDHLFKWNVSLKDTPTQSTSELSVTESTFQISENVPSSTKVDSNSLNKTDDGSPSTENPWSTTKQFVWWIPPDTPWWSPETEAPSETTNPTLDSQTSTVAWPPSLATAPWWTPELTESTTGQVSWWTPDPTTEDSGWWYGPTTDDLWWETSSQITVSTEATLLTESTTLVWPPTVGTAPWWTPNLTDAVVESTSAMVSWWVPPSTEDGSWSEATSSSVPPTESTTTAPTSSSEATSSWPPTVGTAPWWTPNLTDATSEVTTAYTPFIPASQPLMTTSTTETTPETTPSPQTTAETTPSPDTTSAAPSFNASIAAPPPALYNPTAVIGYDVQCGVRHRPLEDGKIVGGYSTLPGEIPWQISLQVFTGYGYGTRHICGGSIISKYFVVTAAHCVYGSNSNVFTVVGGDYNLFDIEGHEQRRRVERIYTDFYDKSIYKNDIALLELTRPFKFNEFVSPICLPNPGLTVTADVGLISGWGRLSEGGSLPHILQAAEVPLTPKEECRRSYAVAGYSNYLNQCQVCTGTKQGGLDSCQGDSGGPLACPLPDGRYYLCGITSWGVGCARPDFYGVYTLVSCYSDWVKSILYASVSAKRVNQTSVEGNH
ncbi:hypothetical protein M8J77_008531 [Diaphorina citri]|nr:hypothetical protein M8J77_008531 [Diaphorina citri]